MSEPNYVASLEEKLIRRDISLDELRSEHVKLLNFHAQCRKKPWLAEIIDSIGHDRELVIGIPMTILAIGISVFLCWSVCAVYYYVNPVKVTSVK